MILLSVSSRDTRRAARLAADPPRGAGGLEFRLDLLRSPDPLRLDPGSWRRRSLPRIATCRPPGEGGRFRGGERAREALLGRALEAGFALADLEEGSPACQRMLTRYPGRIIVSHHDRRRTPAAAQLIRRYREMASRPGAAVIKIVTTARDSRDILELRLLLRLASSERLPLIAFAMGEYGRASRILGPSWGGWATFAHPDDDPSTGEGQLSLREAVETFGIAGIDRETRLAGIIGNPVSRSLSPLIHNRGYDRLEMNWRYIPLPVREVSCVPELIRGLPLMGISVTAPHKRAVIRLPGLMDPMVERIGAANTLVIRRGRIFGHNTDVDGVLDPLSRRVRPAGRIALILGAGGSARAAAVALAGAGARVVVASRRARGGRAVARLAGGRWVPFKEASRTPHDILVNCTPVGTAGSSLPLSLRSGRKAVVGDLVYRPGSTPLVRRARSLGLPSFGGEEVLLAQALRQFRLFTLRDPPARAMGAALARALRVR